MKFMTKAGPWKSEWSEHKQHIENHKGFEDEARDARFISESATEDLAHTNHMLDHRAAGRAWTKVGAASPEQRPALTQAAQQASKRAYATTKLMEQGNHAAVAFPQAKKSQTAKGAAKDLHTEVVYLGGYTAGPPKPEGGLRGSGVSERVRFITKPVEEPKKIKKADFETTKVDPQPWTIYSHVTEMKEGGKSMKAQKSLEMIEDMLKASPLMEQAKQYGPPSSATKQALADVSPKETGKVMEGMKKLKEAGPSGPSAVSTAKPPVQPSATTQALASAGAGGGRFQGRESGAALREIGVQAAKGCKMKSFGKADIGEVEISKEGPKHKESGLPLFDFPSKKTKGKKEAGFYTKLSEERARQGIGPSGKHRSKEKRPKMVSVSELRPAAGWAPSREGSMKEVEPEERKKAMTPFGKGYPPGEKVEGHKKVELLDKKEPRKVPKESRKRPGESEAAALSRTTGMYERITPDPPIPLHEHIKKYPGMYTKPSGARAVDKKGRPYVDKQGNPSEWVKKEQAAQAIDAVFGPDKPKQPSARSATSTGGPQLGKAVPLKKDMFGGQAQGSVPAGQVSSKLGQGPGQAAAPSAPGKQGVGGDLSGQMISLTRPGGKQESMGPATHSGSGPIPPGSVIGLQHKSAMKALNPVPTREMSPAEQKEQSKVTRQLMNVPKEEATRIVREKEKKKPAVPLIVRKGEFNKNWYTSPGGDPAVERHFGAEAKEKRSQFLAKPKQKEESAGAGPLARRLKEGKQEEQKKAISEKCPKCGKEDCKCMDKALSASSIPRVARGLAMAYDQHRSATSVMTRGNSRFAKDIHTGPLTGEVIQDLEEDAAVRTRQVAPMYKSCGGCGRTYMAKGQDAECPTCSISKSMYCGCGLSLVKGPTNERFCPLCG